MKDCPHCGKPLSREFLMNASASIMGNVPSQKRVEQARKNGLLGGKPSGLDRPDNPLCAIGTDCSWKREVRVLELSPTQKINVCHRHYAEEKKIHRGKKFLNRPNFPAWNDLQILEPKQKPESRKK